MSILDDELYRKDLTRAAERIDLHGLKNKTILVTGGLGLICSAIIDLLVVAGKRESLNICIYLAARSRERFDRKYANCSGIRFVDYDARKPISFEMKPDYILCGAGVASPERYTAEPVETMLSNLSGIRNLLDYAKNKGTKRVLYISSSEVYGRKQTDDSFSEDRYGSIDLDSVRSSYAVAKQASELLCRSYLAEYGVDTVIVRPGHIFGPTASETDRRISSDFAYKAAKSIPLEMKSSGLQKRSYCYCVDAAAAILTVLLKGRAGEAYNICTEEVLTIQEMARICAQAGKVPISYAEPTKDEIQAFNPMRNSSLSCAKLSDLGFCGCFTVREGLEHTVEILRRTG